MQLIKYVLYQLFKDVLQNKIVSTEDADEAPTLKLLSVKPINSSAVSLEVSSSPNSTYDVESSLDGSIWSPAMAEGSVVGSLQAGKTYSFRVKSGGGMSNVVQATVPAAAFIPNMCEYKGRNYTRGGCDFGSLLTFHNMQEKVLFDQTQI